MEQEITLYVESIEYIGASADRGEPSRGHILEVAVTGIDICRLIEEVGLDEILDCADTKSIRRYLKNRVEDDKRREAEGVGDDEIQHSQN